MPARSGSLTSWKQITPRKEQFCNEHHTNFSWHSLGPVPYLSKHMNEVNPAPGPLSTLAAQIRDRLEGANELYHRLILVVGTRGTGKTTALFQLSKSMRLPYKNVNMLLSQRLLELTSKARPLRLLNLLDHILESAGANTVLVDNTEILFDLRLKQDPLKCLEAVSRNRTLVATWNGRIDANALVYAEPGHPEYRRYPDISGLVIDAGKAGKSTPGERR
jgi:hypothetical protein